MKYLTTSFLSVALATVLSPVPRATDPPASDAAFDAHLKEISAPSAPPELCFSSSSTFHLAEQDVQLDLRVIAEMDWPAITGNGTATLGDWMVHLRSRSTKTRSRHVESMLEPIGPEYRTAVKEVLLALLDDGGVYGDGWRPGKTDTRGDGVVIGSPCILPVGSSSYRGLRAAAIVWDAPMDIKRTERKVRDLVSSRKEYVGSSVQNAFVVRDSALSTTDGNIRRDAWKFYVHDDPKGFGNFKFSLVMLDESHPDGRIHTAYRATGEDYGADRFDELAGEDEYLPLRRSDGTIVGTLMVSSLVLEFSLEYLLGSGYDSDGDRCKALNGGIGNTKRLNQDLRPAQ